MHCMEADGPRNTPYCSRGYQVAFDGGARHKSPNAALPSDGPRAAGAGAILWGPPDQEGLRHCLAQVLVSAPAVASSMVAEAMLAFCATHDWGCRWAAVRRNQNKVADELATSATFALSSMRRLAGLNQMS